MAANIASQRAPWELHVVLRDELATVMSNRAAAFLEVGDCISSLVDAEVVIQLKRNWSKGYFRKAKALLKMGRAQEAREAIQAGLAFDPENRVCTRHLNTIDGCSRSFASRNCKRYSHELIGSWAKPLRTTNPAIRQRRTRSHLHLRRDIPSPVV